MQQPTGTLALAHTARMLRRLEEAPLHVRSAEYKRQMRIYGGQWAALTDEAQAEAVEAALALVDMTPDTVAAARAALEN